MEEVDAAQGEAAQDLTLDTIDMPPHSDAQEMMTTASPPASPESMLSLDDLSQEDTQNDPFDTGEVEKEDKQKESSDESEPLQRPQHQSRRDNADRDAKRMETRLQRNLRQQQEHYARQRKLFENLHAERGNSQSECLPISESSNASRDGSELSSPRDGQEHSDRHLKTFPTKHARAGTFRLQTQGLMNIGSISRPKNSFTRGEHTRHQHLPTEDENDEDDNHAQDMLRRIKEKARADFHRQRLSSGGSLTAASTAISGSNDRTVNAPVHFLEEMQQQESSNDALRRQLELLRRLQVENNRFRQESRALRERNEALKERDQVREREVKRLRDDVSELDARVQRDKTSLASAAQTAHKLKGTQKRLAAVQSENRDFQAALQEVREAHDQLQTDSQAETSELVMELKRWKRNTKQLRQQENRTGEEVEFYKKTIAAMEDEALKRRSQLKEAKHESAELSALLAEKTTHFESVETSAAACVERMEVGMEELQKSHAEEHEKRKKAESECSSQRIQLERQQAENALLIEKQGELEQQLVLFQEHWKERKHAHQEQLRRYAAQLEEYNTRHKSDASTIGSMRDEYEAIETRLGETKTAASELKSEIADEARTVQAQVEILRKYVENALRVQPRSSNVDDIVLTVFEEESPVDLERSHREEIWREVPELKVVQGAISALRNEMLDMVHEFQRSRHLVRQQGNKLALSVERATELEHLRAEDATKMKDLREQRKLAEQAREIVSQEKEEVLKWSEQTCAKNETLHTELEKWGHLALQLRNQLRNALKKDVSFVAMDHHETVSTESLARSFLALEKGIDELVSMRDHWRLESEKHAREVHEAQNQLESVEKAQADKSDGFKQTLKEVERLHAKNAQEQKLHLEQCIADLDSEKSTLVVKLQEESLRLAEMEDGNAKLQQQIDSFEQDLPVLATMLHLFVLVVQPLILQVSDLLAQKRLLLRENADYAQAHEQIECIGQVLKEMIPTGVSNPEKVKEQQRRRLFRRVVIAVFAMNRFQHFGKSSDSSSDQSSYGLCAPLKIVKMRKRTHALSLQPTVIKVLPPKATLSRLVLRPLLARLKKLEITERVAKVIDSCSTPSGLMPSSLGNLILKVVIAIDPTSKELLVGNTNGKFHCEALLERRRRLSKNRGDQHDMMAEYENVPAPEDDIPMVALIRKRILALGKRVEDLHYQRNSLQKENYEFQFQLEQQARSLSEMNDLQKKTECLQEEMTALRCQTDQELQRTQEEHQAKHEEIQAKEDELSDAQKKIELLQAEISGLHSEITRTESDRLTLQLQIDKLKTVSIEEEEKADKSKAAVRRQEEEVKSLKQAVKKAHELYQKVSWQLEQEVQEKATLKTVVEHLKRQQEKAERELREEKLKELEKSFNDENDVDDEDISDLQEESRTRPIASFSEVERAKRKSSPPSTKRASFVASLDIGRTCKTAFAVDRERESEDVSTNATKFLGSISPSASVSPLPSRTRLSMPRCPDEKERFRSAWNRLDVSNALVDTPPRSYTCVPDSPTSPHQTSPPQRSYSLLQSDRQTQTPKSKRRIEIDKVNAAVHDYMDRIDDKLSKMYGIPPSSTILRPKTGDNTTHKYRYRDRDDRMNILCKMSEDDDNWDASSSCDSFKANEVRVQQYQSDSGAYDT